MYNQDEFIYNEFKKNYTDIKEAIVIYGIGIDTGKLIPKIQEYNIIGLMDGRQKRGEIYGKRIVDYNELLEFCVKKIVIVARPAVLSVIYHRIEKFAGENDIFVGDVQGRNLANMFCACENDIPYFKKNWIDLKKACAKHEIVTFDIFDTLIMRKTAFPKDIFEVVEMDSANTDFYIADFAEIRINAEDKCYKKKMNPTIYQIYDEMKDMAECSEETKLKYLEREIRTEKQFLCARKSMLDFFNEIKKEKEIYLISDMYLTSEILKDILTGCGYTGYKAIFVSCEQGCSKSDGLFEKFIKEDERRANALHIGDNEFSDGKSAENAGLDVFLIMNKIEMLENSTYSGILDKTESLLDRISIGLFCNRAFDDPFALYGTKGKLMLDNHKDIAYLFIAPEILYFSCWLIDSIIKSNCDYVIYPSRDAFVLRKICSAITMNQKITGFPDGQYTYVSRRALHAATVFEQADIERIVSHEYNGSTLEVFKKRFNVTLPEETEGYDLDTVVKLAKKYSGCILERCRQERANYLAYLEQNKLGSKKKLAFIDFVAAGTIQNGLRKLLHNDIQGFYFLKRKTDDMDRERNLDVLSFYPSKGDFELDANIYRFYLFFELLLTSPEATLNYIFDDLNPVFLQEQRSRDEIDLVMEMQDEMFHFADEISKLHPSVLSEPIDRGFPDTIVGFLEKEYSDIECEQMQSMDLTDEYFSKTFNIFDR